MNKSQKPKEVSGSLMTTNSGTIQSAMPSGVQAKSTGIKGVGAQFHTNSGTIARTMPTGQAPKSGQVKGVAAKFTTKGSPTVQKMKPRTPSSSNRG